MKKYNLLSVILLMAIGTWSINAQEYLEMIDKGTFTVFEIQQSAQAYFDKNGTGQGSGYKQYKRWEYNALRMQGDDGRLKSVEYYNDELARFEAYLNESTAARLGGSSGNWVEEGPTSWNSYQGWNPGVGRITGLAIDPADSNHIVIGANTGGVWKTTDGGTNWTPLMDYFSNMYVYSVAMDPTDSNTYFAGSRNGLIYKSTDAGATWSQLAVAGGGSIVNKIMINPSNTDIMFASVEYQGTYRSTNGGASWTNVIPGSTASFDVEFMPGDPTVVYATGYGAYKSTNSGASFSAMPSSAGSLPKMIGVSAADPDRVYVVEVAINSAGTSYVYGRTYRSYDAGVSFTTLEHGDENYFGYLLEYLPGNSLYFRSQAPRDMDIVVNPTDADDVFIAGINPWRSLNAADSFEPTAGWSLGEAASYGVGYCHADVDILYYDASGKLYAGTDGGIYVANDPTGIIDANFWTDLTFGLGIRQFYKIGISQSDPVIVSGGAQDNGTSVLTPAGEWRDWLGADGMETFIDKDDNNWMYGTTQGGQLYRTTNGGSSIIYLSEPGPGGGNWVTPFEQDPNVTNTIYVGYNGVYKSTNSGGSYSLVSQTFPRNLDELKIAPTNSDVMWGCYILSGASNSQLYKTEDGGATSWVNVPGTLGYINSIAIHPLDSDKVAITTNYSGAQVYVTLDGGDTWLNYKKNLPGFQALGIVWDDTSVNGLYVGMNYGLFYIDDTFTDWQVFNTNLPNVIVNELEINNVNDRIYAGTYGRGLWSSPVYDNPLSVADNSFEQLVQLYPNPAKNEVTLKWPSSSEVDLQVFDVNGRLLINLKDQFIENEFNLNIAKLSPGVHFVRLSSEGSTIVKKLIVN